MTEELTGWQWASAQGRERTNREAIRVWEPGPADDAGMVPAIAVLANGIGAEGGATADVAATAACKKLERQSWPEMAGAMRAAAAAANEAIRSAKAGGTLDENGATGLLLVAMKDDAVTWWGAGNSTLLRLRLRETLETMNEPAGTAISVQTPAVALMGMPYGDPDLPNDGADAPERPAPLLAGDLIIAATAGITPLSEEETERILRDALTQDGNPAEEVVRTAMLKTPPSLYNLSVATRRAAAQAERKKKQRKDRSVHARIEAGKVIVTVDGKHLNPKTSQRLKNLSSEFGWGYRGNGAQQLAFGILYTITRNLDEAERHYEKLYAQRISRMIGREWSLDSDEIREWIAKEVAHEAAELEKSTARAAADEETRRATARTSQRQRAAAERVAADQERADEHDAQRKAGERVAAEEEALSRARAAGSPARSDGTSRVRVGE